jgi:hypothetical protein
MAAHVADPTAVPTARAAPTALPWNLRLARLVRRLALPAVVVAGILLWRSYGVIGVPDGMDTMPQTHPPGTRCVVAKRPGKVVSGAVVFVDVPGGGTLLARVVAVAPDGSLAVAPDNPATRFAAALRAPVPPAAVRGLVLVALTPTPEVPVGQ